MGESEANIGLIVALRQHQETEYTEGLDLVHAHVQLTIPNWLWL